MNRLTILFFLCLLLSFSSIAQDTLRHITLDEPLIAYPVSSENIACGYASGQNCEGSEKYAEKYFIKDTGKVSGIEVHFEAKVRNFSRAVAFDVYSVRDDGFPGDTLGRKIISYRNLIATGSPYYLNFDSPVEIKDSFYVAINFLNYAHEPFSDTIGILTSFNGTRPASDLMKKGRNAIKLHHGDWVDLYTQTNLAVFLGLNPIGDFVSGEIIGDPFTTVHEKQQTNHFTVYPLPAKDFIHFKSDLPIEKEAKIEIFDLLNKKYENIKHSKENDLITIDVSDFSNGLYNYVIKSETTTNSGKFSVIK